MANVASYSVRKLNRRKKLPTYSIIYELKLIRCGKEDCSCCPHGPYWYRKQWENGRLKTRYVGKERPFDVTAEQEAAAMANLPIDQLASRRRPRKTKEPRPDSLDPREIKKSGVAWLEWKRQGVLEEIQALSDCPPDAEGILIGLVQQAYRLQAQIDSARKALADPAN